LNRERANEIMDRYGLDALVAAMPQNVYYLSSHDNAFYTPVSSTCCSRCCRIAPMRRRR
jgi:hypothetical protein